MDFDRAQHALDALQANCPHTDLHKIDVWVSAITRAREALVELQIYEDSNPSLTGVAPVIPPPELPQV